MVTAEDEEVERDIAIASGADSWALDDLIDTGGLSGSADDYAISWVAWFLSEVEQALLLVQHHRLSIAEVRVPCSWTVEVSNEFRELVDDLAGDEEATETLWEWACEHERELGAPLVQALGEMISPRSAYR